MKKAILSLLFIYSISYSQLLFNEEFAYPANTRFSSSSWIISGIHPYILSNSLTYSGYPSNPGTNLISLDENTNDVTLRASISLQSAGTIYCSFLMKINTINNIGIEGAHFFCFGSDAVNRGFIMLKKGIGENTFKLGIKKKEFNSPEYSSDLNIDETYLIVIGYSFVNPGSDICKLWINPPLDGSEPEPTIFDAMSTDIVSIKHIELVQGSLTGDLYVDAIRVATSWSQAPLPVELSNFTALFNKNRVELNWSTKTEVNNYGFEIERSYDKMLWESIGFVEGCGNSNSEKCYSAYDDKMSWGEVIYYRLKQIDTDGTYTFSKVAEVNMEISGYALYQNYPNPFNPETRIRWRQELDGVVNLRIYDTTGRLIRSIIEARNAGFNEIVFSANILSSGIYYYELQIGDFRARKRMLVLK